MFLGEIAEPDHDKSGDDFGHRWVNAEFFYKQFNEDIIKQNANGHQQEIAKELNATMKAGSRKNDMTHQQKPGGKADQKGHHECSNMRFERQRTEVEDLLMQYEIIADIVNQDVQHGVRSPAGGIAKGLYGHQLPEGRIKVVQKGNDLLFGHNAELRAKVLKE